MPKLEITKGNLRNPNEIAPYKGCYCYYNFTIIIIMFIIIQL